MIMIVHQDYDDRCMRLSEQTSVACAGQCPKLLRVIRCLPGPDSAARSEGRRLITLNRIGNRTVIAQKIGGNRQNASRGLEDGDLSGTHLPAINENKCGGRLSASGTIPCGGVIGNDGVLSRAGAQTPV